MMQTPMAAAVEDYLSGKSMREAAAGRVHPTTLLRYMQQHDIPRRPRNTRKIFLSREDVAPYEQGVPIRPLAQRLGVSDGVVIQALHDHGIPLRTRMQGRTAPVGARRTTADGYVLVKTEAGWEREHRVVKAVAEGRLLHPWEEVHHINGIRDDNRPENLEIWVSSHPSGQRLSDQLAWARKLVAAYGTV